MKADKKTPSMKASTHCHKICTKKVNGLPCARGCKKAKGHASNYLGSHKCYGGHVFT